MVNLCVRGRLITNLVLQVNSPLAFRMHNDSASMYEYEYNHFIGIGLFRDVSSNLKEITVGQSMIYQRRSISGEKKNNRINSVCVGFADDRKRDCHLILLGLDRHES